MDTYLSDCNTGCLNGCDQYVGNHRGCCPIYPALRTLIPGLGTCRLYITKPPVITIPETQHHVLPNQR